ncbi:MAG: hypothetical protein ACXVAX_10045 [Pseudobdellovibrio sp.]
MNNLLSKRLLCGVIATTFFLINCQKAPTRGVKAQQDPNGKIASTAKAVDCSDDMITKLNARTDLRSKIGAILADPSKITPDLKLSLQQLIGNLNDASKAAFDAISAAKPGTNACNQKDPKDPKGVILNAIDAMKGDDYKMALNVQQITGQSNSIIDNWPFVLVAGKNIWLGADLAALLSDANNLNGAKMISEGKISDGGAALDALKADKTKSACIVTSIDKQPVAANAKVAVLNLAAPRVDDKSKRNMTDLSLAIKADGQADRALGMSCVIAAAADPSAEIMKSLGSLVSTKAPAADASNVNNTQVIDPASAGASPTGTVIPPATGSASPTGTVIPPATGSTSPTGTVNAQPPAGDAATTGAAVESGAAAAKPVATTPKAQVNSPARAASSISAADAQAVLNLMDGK